MTTSSTVKTGAAVWPAARGAGVGALVSVAIEAKAKLVGSAVAYLNGEFEPATALCRPEMNGERPPEVGGVNAVVMTSPALNETSSNVASTGTLVYCKLMV